MLPLIAVGLGLYSAWSEYRAGRFNEQVARYNQHLAQVQSQDALARGYQEESQRRRATRRLIGAQRARLAAQGLDVNSGDAALIQEQTAAAGEEDALTIRNNAQREAWGYRVQAADYGFQAKQARREGTERAVGTIISSGANAAGYYYARNSDRLSAGRPYRFNEG